MIAKTQNVPQTTAATKHSEIRKNEKNTVNVFFASDRNYLPYLAVAIQSLSSFANKKYFYNVRILSEDLSTESLSGVMGKIKPNVRISVFSVADKISHIKEDLALRLRDYYSDAIYYRIFIAEMFPTLKRAVYLDSDIVLNTDVAKLYFTPIAGSPPLCRCTGTPHRIILPKSFWNGSRWSRIHCCWAHSSIAIMRLKSMMACSRLSSIRQPAGTGMNRSSMAIEPEAILLRKKPEVFEWQTTPLSPHSS